MNLFNLMATLTLDSSQYEKGVESAKTKGNGLAGGMKALGGAALGVGAAVAAGAAALYGMTDSAAKATDRIDKMSQKLSLSRQGFQEWVIA